MVRIAVVEDDRNFSDQFVQFLEQYGRENCEEFRIAVFRDGMDILRQYRAEWDIILMDIEMEHLDGMETARRIRERDGAVVIIFITAMTQYALKGYEVDAMDYVLKPVNFASFARKLKKALQIVRSQRRDTVFLPMVGETRRIYADDILYIEKINHQLHFHSLHGILVISGTMWQWEEKLEGMHFLRCNSGYLVNLAHVTNYRKDTIQVGDDILTISRPRQKAVMQAFSDYIGGMH